MNDPVRTSAEVYLHHYDEANRLLASGQVAMAQVHATLAQAVAASRVADSMPELIEATWAGITL